MPALDQHYTASFPRVVEQSWHAHTCPSTPYTSAPHPHQSLFLLLILLPIYPLHCTALSKIGIPLEKRKPLTPRGKTAWKCQGLLSLPIVRRFCLEESRAKPAVGPFPCNCYGGLRAVGIDVVCHVWIPWAIYRRSHWLVAPGWYIKDGTWGSGGCCLGFPVLCLGRGGDG